MKIITISIFLTGVILLLFLPQSIPIIARSSYEIPQGWDIVSQSDRVTHIRMREGASTYHWITEREKNDFYLNLTFSGNPYKDSMKPDKNGNVHIVIYMGYHQVERKVDNLPSESDAYRLVFKSPGMKLMTLHEFDVDTVTTQSNVVFDQGKVGLKEAIIYTVPLDEFSKEHVQMSTFIQFEYKNTTGYIPTHTARQNAINLNYYKMDGMLHFDSNYSSGIIRTHSNAIYLHASTINRLLAVFAIGWAIFSIYRDRKAIQTILPCIIGAVYSWLALLYFQSRPSTSDDMFAGLQVSQHEIDARLGIIGFILLAIVLLIVHAIVSTIRKRKLY